MIGYNTLEKYNELGGNSWSTFIDDKSEPSNEYGNYAGSGTYIYKIQANNQIKTFKMMLLK